ncbi:hypothetical protein Bcen2424_3992 [Burkholderia cenocepacia HI2424]|nr:hypothetical protein Bcen2424_3992 [Burkholderia cenocepacia HI2424]
MQRPVVDVFRDGHPVRFLLVRDEMLRHRDHPVRLNRLNFSDAQRAGQIRVLAHVFEIAAADGQSGQVHARCFEHMKREVRAFLADHVAELRRHRMVERCRHRDRGRQRSGFRGRGTRQRRRTARRRAGGNAIVLADPDRAIRDAQRRDVVFRQPGNVTCTEALRELGDYAGAAHQLRLLVGQCHCRHEQGGALRRLQRRIHPVSRWSASGGTPLPARSAWSR